VKSHLEASFVSFQSHVLNHCSSVRKIEKMKEGKKKRGRKDRVDERRIE